MSRKDDVLGALHTAREYTQDLLEHVPDVDWFRQPSEGVTHIAWQVGHLAMAEYRLALERIRGSQPGDEELISVDFMKQFGKGSVPDPDPANNPSPEVIRDVFERVHQQTLKELEELPDKVLDEPTAQPHRMFQDKIGALRWCAQHEMLHAGQIGLLRRLLGQPWLR